MDFKSKYKSKYNTQSLNEIGVFYPKFKPTRTNTEIHKNYSTKTKEKLTR